MNKQGELISLITDAFGRGIIRKLVFSRPKDGSPVKISGRLSELRGERVLALEYSLPGNTVSHKNVRQGELFSLLSELIPSYSQINLLTTAGDAEYKVSGSGKEALLGKEKLVRKLNSDALAFESAIEELDRRKSYMLSGSEDFLIALGISDNSGRVHDKRQGKFRQINRFLEEIEEIYHNLPESGELRVYDLCCGKSYLSFAVYYYLTAIKGRSVQLLGIDLKRDVIIWCSELCKRLGYTGMTFTWGDVKNTPNDVRPDMVISLHACDTATDVVLDTAARLGTKVILSTPCCHRHLSKRIKSKELSFVTDYPHLKNKLCDTLTDAIRLLKLEAVGYTVAAVELTDPDDTPKNTLLRAVRRDECTGRHVERAKERYRAALAFLLGEGVTDYPEGI
ncbi:MAG: SAM-dependent methyltransferase [Clostridia bacterium]|nr:SAM-dependent methyltransferase [Clostridia bacterium]